MILVIDNYDSFVYNLVQELKMLGVEVVVKRRHQLLMSEAIQMKPQAVLVSPGPGRPEAAVECNDIIRYFSGKIPILGVCLGHQCIGYSFGAKVTFAKQLMHGKTSGIFNDGKTIYADLSNPFQATRYHSLIVSEEGLPETLEVSAYTADGEIMGLRVKGTQTEGVQFHPESFLAREGKKIIRNFVEIGRDA